MSRLTRRSLTYGALILTATLVASGCASSTPDDQAAAEDEVTYIDASGDCAGQALDGIDLKTAQDVVAEYQTPPTQLPVAEPLPEAPDPDTLVVVVDNGAQVGTLLASFIEQAAAAAGVKYQRVVAGTDAQTINSALNTVVELKPDIVIAAALDPSFFIDQLDVLRDSGTVFVTPAITNAEEFGLTDSYIGKGSSEAYGELLASLAVALTCGTTKEFVYYNVPELPPANLQLEATKEFLPTICEDCNLRVVDLPIATLDTTAGDAIVSDLQAHPETKYFSLAADQAQIGLKAKQELAGLDVPGYGQSSLPPNIEQISQGLQLAGTVTDYEYMSWLFLDEGLRRAQAVEVDYDDWTKINPLISQVVTEENAAKYAAGEALYPDFKEQLLEIWGK